MPYLHEDSITAICWKRQTLLCRLCSQPLSLSKWGLGSTKWCQSPGFIFSGTTIEDKLNTIMLVTLIVCVLQYWKPPAPNRCVLVITVLSVCLV